MKHDVIKLDGTKSGSVELDGAVFGQDPRADILQRVVRWQLAKRQSGTHDVKNRSEIARTGKKSVRQKGSGGARHGSMRSNVFRGGGRAFGPTPRSHAHDLPKKVRALGLKVALSSKLHSKQLIVVDSLDFGSNKTKDALDVLSKLGVSSALFVDVQAVNENFSLGVRNIPNVDTLPTQGLNVYDILRRDHLVLTKGAVEALEARLK